MGVVILKFRTFFHCYVEHCLLCHLTTYLLSYFSILIYFSLFSYFYSL